MLQRPRVLHMFSGLASRTDGLAAWLLALGFRSTDIDIINLDTDNMDLAEGAA